MAKHIIIETLRDLGEVRTEIEETPYQKPLSKTPRQQGGGCVSRTPASKCGYSPKPRQQGGGCVLSLRLYVFRRALGLTAFNPTCDAIRCDWEIAPTSIRCVISPYAAQPQRAGLTARQHPSDSISPTSVSGAA